MKTNCNFGEKKDPAANNLHSHFETAEKMDHTLPNALWKNTDDAAPNDSRKTNIICAHMRNNVWEESEGSQRETWAEF